MIKLNINLHKEILNFSNDDKNNCIEDINLIFKNDDWNKEAPKYQTKANLFKQNKPHWARLEKLITEKVSKYFDVSNCYVKAWAYVKVGDDISDVETNLWHTHEKNNPVCTAIFYLNSPENADATEFMDEEGNVYRPKIDNNLLLIFDSLIKHRPPVWVHRNKFENRYVVAIDYKEKKMDSFKTTGYTIVRGFLDQQSVQTISRYLENALKRYPENNQGGGPNDSSKISWYADPLIETVLINSLPEMEKITGYKLFPSYSFTRVYTKGDELRPHTDRPACEVSVTCHVATVGKPWPIWMQAPGAEPSENYLEPGDACIYHGCEIKHWREPATETDVNVQFMLHYVRQDGPNADHKFDKRPGLGFEKHRS